MRYLKYFALLALLVTPVTYSHAQVSIGVQIGPSYGIYNAPPVCDYGFYPDYPFGCAPYGYYAPTWFVDGVFIGAGPWYNFYYTRPVYYRPFYFNRGFGFHSFHDRDDFRRFRDDDRFRGERFRGSRDEDGFRRFRDGDRREGFRGDDRDRGGDRGRGGDHGFRGDDRGGDHGRGGGGYRGVSHNGGGGYHGGGGMSGGGGYHGGGSSHGGGGGNRGGNSGSRGNGGNGRR
jgi:hypothetical protein